jgi:hypothetical protein
MNPFISFCVYVAARVFVQYLKTRPNDQQMNSSLQFLLQAMQALRRKNPLTESFLVQLDLDLEGAGISKPYMPVEKKDAVIPVNSDPVGCSSIYEIRETQAQNAPVNTYANNRTRSSNTAPQFSHSNNQQPPPAFGLANGSGIEIAPQPAPFVPIRSLQDLQQDFSPHRGAVPGASTFVFNENNGNDMELSNDQPSPSTTNSQSRGGSTSHSSYSPGQQTEHHLPYRASPRFTSNQMPTSHIAQSSSSASLHPMSYTSNDMAMNGFASETINNGAYENGFDWEFSAMGGEIHMGQDMDAGITPGTWNSMLESVMEGGIENVPMGWDVLGTPHGSNVDASGAAGQS